MTLDSLVGHGVGNPPISQIANRVVSSWKAPCGSHPLGEGRSTPAIIPRFARPGRGIKTPQFFSGQGIMRRDVAVLPPARAGAPGDDFPIEDHRVTGRI